MVPIESSRPDEHSGDLSGLRREYRAATLEEADAALDPWTLFEAWFADAVAAPEIVEANAMVLATASDDGTPSARTVLLKGIDPVKAGAGRGFVLFTNIASRKGRDLAARPQCQLLFEWHAIQRQVRVPGRAALLGTDEVEAYFASRPRGARLGAWASQQSSVVASRAELEQAYEDAVARFGPEESDGPVPVPPTWGGYRVVPTSWEFWQGRPSRLHDRLEYLPDEAEPTGWMRRRLAP